MSLTNPWAKIQKPLKNYNVLRIDSTHPLDFFWSIDKFGNYLLICEKLICNKVPVFPDLQGIQVALPLTSLPNTHDFALILKDSTEWELFYAICKDILECTRNATIETGLSIILRRISSWQQFLRKKRGNLLNEDQIKGLLGELLFIKDWLAPNFGWEKAITFWSGPFGTPQDFCIDDMVIEIKSQLSVTKSEIRISSAEQLTPQTNKMHLHVLTFGKASEKKENTYTLTSVIHEIRTCLLPYPTSLERFLECLLNVGYFYSSYYDSYIYNIIDETTFEVREGFPRITTQNLPSGIVKIKYDISLEDCSEYIGAPSWMEK